MATRRVHPFRSCSHRWLGLLVTLLGVTSTGCSLEQSPFAGLLMPDPSVDHSFLSQQPCAAPCWYNLELDKSSEADVLSQLKQLPFVKPESITTRPSRYPSLTPQDATFITYECAIERFTPCGYVVISRGNVKEIATSVNYELHADTLVQRFGTPNSAAYYPYGVDAPGCVILFNWVEHWVVAEVMDGNRPVADCEPKHFGTDRASNLRIDMLHYAGPDWIEMINRKSWWDGNQ